MNILAISMAYPPLAYPRSIQVARLLKHAGQRTVLVCADEEGSRLDRTIEPEAEASLLACVRVPVRKRRLDQLVDRLTYRFLRRVWNQRNLAPDTYGAWKSDVLIAVEKYLGASEFSPDAVVTFAQPFTDHLIGLELKRRLGKPWLAHFSDPWADNPFSHFDRPTREANLRLERSVAEAADLLVFTSAETVDLFFEKYPKDLKNKARVLPQCFDPDQFGPDVPGGAMTIRYLGNFYGRRTPAPLLQALRSIAKDDSEILEDLTFELVGSGDAEDVQRMAIGLPKDLVTVRPSVDYSKSLALMSQSDGLLVIDAPAEKSVFLPSKLIDYIGADRPIFGITPPGAASKLISQIGGEVADPSDVKDMVLKLRIFIDKLRQRRIEQMARWGDEKVRECFSAEMLARDFNLMMDELIA